MFDVRPARDRDEFGRALYGIGQYFGGPPTEDQLQRFTQVLPVERMHAAFEDDEIVGGAGAFPFDMSVPGGSLPCGGVTVVGGYPTHRRRGVWRALMDAQLADIHERGEPIAALWASEETIYGRFGYGIASWCGEVSLAHEYTAFATTAEPSGTMRLIEPEEALELLPAVYERVRLQWPGMFSRNRLWWEHREVDDPEARRDGAGPKRWVVHEQGGKIDGYAVYRHKPGWVEGSTSAELRVIEALGASDGALRDLWAYLLAIDWKAKMTSWLLPLGHPLFLLLATPRRLRFRMGDCLWVRVIDVGAALSARRYLGEGTIVLDVADEFCPWNEGRWKLENGSAERTDEAADLRVPAQSLGSAYLGGVP